MRKLNISEQSEWTPGESTFLDDSSFSEKESIFPTQDGIVETYNEAMEKLCTKLQDEKFHPLEHALNKTWEMQLRKKKKTCVETAVEGRRIICKVIAPRGSEELFQAVKQPTEDAATPELLSLMTAYKNASTKRLKTQILSLYAYRYSASHLMKLHESVEKISARQIKKARAHAKTVGSGMPVEKAKKTSCIYGYGQS